MLQYEPMSPKGKIITVIGNVGSGKTTLSLKLSKLLNARLVKADTFYLTNPFFPLAVKDRRRWSLTSDLWFLYKRVEMMKKTLSKKNKKYVVIDSGLPMSWVYSHSRIKSGFCNRQEWELYKIYNNLLTNSLPKTTILIQLKASTDFLLKRIKKRGRDFEIKFFDKNYLNSLANSLMTYKKEIVKRSNKLITINVEKNDFIDPEFLNNLTYKVRSV